MNDVSSTGSNIPAPSTESPSVSSGDVVCEGGVCRKVTKPAETPEPSESSEPSETTNTKALEDKIKIAKELLEKKKKEKENEEAKVE